MINNFVGYNLLIPLQRKLEQKLQCTHDAAAKQSQLDPRKTGFQQISGCNFPPGGPISRL